MKFIKTPFEGAWVLELEPREDDRGWFARSFCTDEFKDHGIDFAVVQANMAYTAKEGTLRGMHYQVPPAAEAKLMRCIRGKVHDVLIDLRPESSTYKMSYGVELSAENRRALYVPPMFGHGYLSLVDDCEMFYLVSEFYTPGAERGIRFDDPAFAIEWPIEPTVVSEKDRSWDLFES